MFTVHQARVPSCRGSQGSPPPSLGGMFAIENTRTRNSLRTVFENIFQKYGREFEEDDEIDLMSLEVTKAGGHLARIKPLAFGRAFKGKHLQSSNPDRGLDSQPDEREADDHLGRDVFEFGQRKTCTEQVAYIQSSFNQAVASRKAKEAERKLTSIHAKKKPKTFEAALLRILKEEQKEIKQFTRRQCHRSDCFDCIFFENFSEMDSKYT